MFKQFQEDLRKPSSYRERASSGGQPDDPGEEAEDGKSANNDNEGNNTKEFAMLVDLLSRFLEVGERCNCLVDEGELLGVHVKSNTELTEERQAESQVGSAQIGIFAP